MLADVNLDKDFELAGLNGRIAVSTHMLTVCCTVQTVLLLTCHYVANQHSLQCHNNVTVV